jgi:DNA repair protein SbcD/Mre11
VKIEMNKEALVSIRIFHTADLHLDMKFPQYPEIRYELKKARYETLERMVRIANERACDVFVIAGDLFDRVSVPRDVISRAVSSLRGFKGALMAVLPGNHDFISFGHSELWKYFQQSAFKKILVLEKPQVYPLRNFAIDACLYPAPCTAKYADHGSIQWISEAEKSPDVKHHIGIAHGSLKGFSPDLGENYYPISDRDLLQAGLDLWLLGHTHYPYPPPGASPPGKIFYPGIPEPRGFEGTPEGKAWIIEIDDHKEIKETSVATGRFRFMDEETDVSAIGLEGLREKFSSSELGNVLLRLKITGSLSPHDFGHLQTFKEEVQKSLFYLQWDHSNVDVKLTIDEINRGFTGGSFPHRLLSKLAAEGDHHALRIAWELIGGSRK